MVEIEIFELRIFQKHRFGLNPHTSTPQPLTPTHPDLDPRGFTQSVKPRPSQPRALSGALRWQLTDHLRDPPLTHSKLYPNFTLLGMYPLPLTHYSGDISKGNTT